MSSCNFVKTPNKAMNSFETLTLMLLVAHLANTKLLKNPEEMTETLAYGYSSEGTPDEARAIQ